MGEARGDQTQRGLKESETVKSLSTTEKPVGEYPLAWPPSVHDATGDSSPGLVVISDQRDGRCEGRCYDSQSLSVISLLNMDPALHPLDTLPPCICRHGVCP